jgi:gluconate 2-dehydrogenase gamma chain
MRTNPQREKVNFISQRKMRDWELSRKQFIRSMAMGGIMAQTPFFKLVGQGGFNKNSILSEKQQAIVSSVQEILFPNDDNGPGASEINALEYLLWVLADAEKDTDEVNYLIDGIGWTDETAEEEFSKNYLDLAKSEREQLVELISKEGWGESWLSMVLTLIFEALLCDPHYGGNPESIGWKWLEHDPGQPRPTSDLLYPGIINTVRKS